MYYDDVMEGASVTTFQFQQKDEEDYSDSKMMVGWHGRGKCQDDKKSIIGPTCQLAVRLWSHLHLIPTNKNLPRSELSSEKDIMFVLFWQTI